MTMFYKEMKFKETPRGKIPKDWDVVKVEDLGEVVTGTTPSTFVKEYWNGKYPFVTPTDITQSEYVRKTERKITEKGLQKGRLIPKDSVLVTCIASIGKIALASESCITNQQINAIICKQKVDPHYVYYATTFRTKILRAWAGRTTNPIVKKSLFEKFPLPLPKNVNEQQKIALALSTIDEVIQKVDEVIAKTERLKKGLMQELLTKGIGHKEFKDTKIGRIPKEWKVVKLRDVVDNKQAIVAGPFGSNLKVSDYRPVGVPIIRLQNIERNRFINKDIKYTSSEKAKELSYHSYQPGDLVLAKLGDPIGKTCIVPPFMGKGIVVADVVRIRLSPKKATKQFIEYMLNSSICFKQLRKETIGSTRPRVNISQVRDLELLLPSLEEQQKIAEILLTVDKKLELERNEKTKLERIKQELMDLLLTGKVRIKVN